MPLYYYGDNISEHIIEAPNGSLICKDVPIGRTGSMKYQAKDLDLKDRDPFEIVEVHREEEDVFDLAAIASFEGMPVTDGHPAEDVTLDNWSLYAKGHVQNVRRGTGELADKMVGDLFITDPILKEKVKNRIKREVSSGYQCRYGVGRDGRFRQFMLRGNHVAVVDAGRAGKSVAIMDSIEPSQKVESVTKPYERRTPRMSTSAEKFRGLIGLAMKTAKDAGTQDEVDSIVQDVCAALDGMTSDERKDPPKFTAAAEPGAKAGQIEAKANDQSLEKVMAALDEMKTEVTAKLSSMDERINSLTTQDAKMKEEEEEDAKAKDASVIPATDVSNGAAVAAAGEKSLALNQILSKLIGDAASETITVKASEDADAPGMLSNDAALEIMQQIAPAIASIKDSAERTAVKDTLIRALEPRVSMPVGSTDTINLVQTIANMGAAQAHDSDVATAMDVDSRQSAYDKRNPHIAQKGE